jgi:anti-anti-sigma factor
VEPDFQSAFELTIAREGSHTVISLRGELDIATEGELAAGLALVLAERTSVLTVDLRELEFLDSTGLRALLSLREECAAHDCRLRLVRGGDAVQRAFDVSGLTEHFAMVDASGSPLSPPGAG